MFVPYRETYERPQLSPPRPHPDDVYDPEPCDVADNLRNQAESWERMGCLSYAKAYRRAADIIEEDDDAGEARLIEARFDLTSARERIRDYMARTIGSVPELESADARITRAMSAYPDGGS